MQHLELIERELERERERERERKKEYPGSGLGGVRRLVVPLDALRRTRAQDPAGSEPRIPRVSKLWSCVP